MPSKLSHYDQSGKSQMVDVSGKSATRREAEASAFVVMSPAVLQALENNPKGSPLETARLAGIMAAKKTADLIPLCHPLPVHHAQVEFESRTEGIRIECRVTTVAQTGVEMEALTGATIAALTIYDMCKAIDKAMVISGVRLVSKSKESL